jgi:hypothetical protein
MSTIPLSNIEANTLRGARVFNVAEHFWRHEVKNTMGQASPTVTLPRSNAEEENKTHDEAQPYGASSSMLPTYIQSKLNKILAPLPANSMAFGIL